jgi:tRNA A-37 threonylcarbamoyl transferase component Bud32
LISQEANAAWKADGDFVEIRRGGWLILFRKDFGEDGVTDLISAVAGPAENQRDFTRVPSSDYTRVFRLGFSVEGKARVFYLKRYLSRSLFDRLKHVFRPSRARRAFEASRMLKCNGVDCPDVVALFERRQGPFHADNLLLTEEVDGCMALCDYLGGSAGASTGEALREKRRFISFFGKTVGRMHAKGIFHGDLRLGNILVRKEDKGWRLFLIDNERTRKFCHLPVWLRFKNLVQVNMSRDGISNSDRMRFFRAYIDANIFVQGRHKRWARKVAGRTRRRLLRKDWFDG